MSGQQLILKRINREKTGDGLKNKVQERVRMFQCVAL